MPTALVTGSSRGIGRAIARKYARDGYDVAVNYVSSESRAAQTVEEIRTRTDQDAVAFRADIGDPDAATTLVEDVAAEFDGLDHVVNNAARNKHVYTPDLSPEAFDRIMDTNVNGTFAVSKAALPYLRESSVSPGPSITNLSSRLAFEGAAYECHYASSKAAILGLTKSHAQEFAPKIRVNAIAPGYVETDMTDATNDEADKRDRRETIPLETLGRPEDIANAAAYLRDARFVTGETLHVNGGELMW